MAQIPRVCEHSQQDTTFQRMLALGWTHPGCSQPKAQGRSPWSQPAVSSPSPVSGAPALTEAEPRGTHSVPACRTHSRLWHPGGCTTDTQPAPQHTAAVAGAAAEQSPARSLAAEAAPTSAARPRWQGDLRRAAWLLLLPSWALRGRACRLPSDLLLKTVRPLKTGLVLWVRVGVEDGACASAKKQVFPVC